MSFFADFFHKVDKTDSVILIDISTGSIAGAYVQNKKGALPALLYSRRMPIEMREGEAHEAAMLRALKVLSESLLREGAPVLARATGSGAANSILVSIDAPWQKTIVRMEEHEEKPSFVFSRGLVADIVKKTDSKALDTQYADESIIGTMLNGYQTSNPYGKRAHRAQIVILTSRIDTRVAKGIIATLQATYHTKKILPIAGDSMRYQVLRTLFPYEKSALLIDATSPLTTVALVNKGLFICVDALPVDDKQPWIDRVVKQFSELGTRYPLPRTIFLLARDPESVDMQKALSEANLGKLWLSDTPPRIVAVVPSHLSEFVKQVTTAPPDLSLLFMAIYWQNRSLEK
ncbi:MAG: hypothetical protein JWN18_544 [Parcubacteria group bacterium]|nr:hypothetical protein [Parcubacteria group bacterium]